MAIPDSDHSGIAAGPHGETDIIASLDRPLIEPEGTLRDGYVPNVVYSCGGVVHDGVLWLPYGVGDARVRVASVVVEDLLDEMTPVDAG